VRALACRDLAARGGESAIATLFEAAQSDPLPPLRAEAARLVGGLLLEAEAMRLFTAYQAEREPAVREAWWSQFCRFGGQAFVRDEMRKKLADERASTAERSAALRGLSSGQSAEETRELLTSVALDTDEPERMRIAAVGLLAEKLPDSTSRGTLLPLSWRGIETPLRSAALRGLAIWLESPAEADPGVMSVVDSYRQALHSSSALLRRTAAEGAGKNPQWFHREISDLLRREPDTRIRRLLEAPGK